MFDRGYKEESVEGIFLKKEQNRLEQNRLYVKCFLLDSSIVFGVRELIVEEIGRIFFFMEFIVLGNGE